jgi:hypothetical protein
LCGFLTPPLTGAVFLAAFLRTKKREKKQGTCLGCELLAGDLGRGGLSGGLFGSGHWMLMNNLL